MSDELKATDGITYEALQNAMQNFIDGEIEMDGRIDFMPPLTDAQIEYLLNYDLINHLNEVLKRIYESRSMFIK